MATSSTHHPCGAQGGRASKLFVTVTPMPQNSPDSAEAILGLHRSASRPDSLWSLPDTTSSQEHEQDPSSRRPALRDQGCARSHHNERPPSYAMSSIATRQRWCAARRPSPRTSPLHPEGGKESWSWAVLILASRPPTASAGTKGIRRTAVKAAKHSPTSARNSKPRQDKTSRRRISMHLAAPMNVSRIPTIVGSVARQHLSPPRARQPVQQAVRAPGEYRRFRRPARSGPSASGGKHVQALVRAVAGNHRQVLVRRSGECAATRSYTKGADRFSPPRHHAGEPQREGRCGSDTIHHLTGFSKLVPASIQAMKWLNTGDTDSRHIPQRTVTPGSSSDCSRRDRWWTNGPRPPASIQRNTERSQSSRTPQQRANTCKGRCAASR